MKWVDLPPVWLVVCLCLAWVFPWRYDPGALAILGWLSLGIGAGLTVLAVVAFVMAKTTIIPRHDPDALITSGVFGRTRNPIYLADVLFLLGASLIWGAWLGLVLVPLFAWMLDRRFIQGEEAVLVRVYGKEFDAYRKAVRRWI